MLKLTRFLPAPRFLSAPAPPRTHLPDVLRIEPALPLVLRLQLRPPDLQLLSQQTWCERLQLQRTLFFSGKGVVRQMDSSVHPAGSSVAPAQDKFCSPSLLFLQDILSGPEFLVDSGASVSVFPRPSSSSDAHVLQRLAAHSSEIFLWIALQVVHLEVSAGSGVSSSPRRRLPETLQPPG